MNSLTDNEIIKALECCVEKGCDTCPLRPGFMGCYEVVMSAVLSIINRQKAEIERLAKALEETVRCFHRMESLYNIKCMELKVAKDNIIQEFSDRLKKRQCHYSETENTFDFDGVTVEDIDDIAEEMTQET